MPVFMLELKFDDKGAVTGIQRLNQIGSAASSTESEISKLGQSLKNTAQNVLALVGAYKTIGAMKDFVRRGVEFNSSMESSRIGIASLITSMVNLEDAQGRTLEGAEKYAAAQGLAADMMKEIQRLGLETTATTQELVEGVQSVMGSAVQAGLALKDIPEFAVAGAQAMQTLGIPLQQMRTELDALLTGRVNGVQDILAPKLFPEIPLDKLGEYLRGLKASGTLLDELKRRLEPFRVAGQDVAQTWKGLTSNLSDAMDVLAGQSAIGFSESLKQSVREIQDFVIDTKEGSVGISADFEHIAEVLLRVENAIGEVFLGATQEITRLLRSLNQAIGDMGGAEAVLDKVQAAIYAVAAGFAALTLSKKIHIRLSEQQKQADNSLAVTQGKLSAVLFKLSDEEKQYAVSLQKSYSEKIRNAEASLKSASAALDEAKAIQTSTLAAKKDASAELKRAESAVLRAKNEQQIYAAEQRRIAAITSLKNANDALAYSETRVATATANVNAALKKVNTIGLVAAGAAKLTTAFRGLVSALGGPVGIAITAATFGLTYLFNRENDAERATRLHAEALEGLEKALGGAGAEIDTFREKLARLSQDELEMVANRLKNALRSATTELGNQVNDIANQFRKLAAEDVSMLFSDDAEEKVAELHGYRKELEEMFSAFRSGKTDAKTLRDQLISLGNELEAVGYSEQAAAVYNLADSGKFCAKELQHLQEQEQAASDALKKTTSNVNQAAAANNDLAAALDAVNKAGQKAPQGAEEAAEWLLKRTAQSETMKKALEEEAKGYDTLALAILNSAAAQAMMTGKAEEGRKLFEKIGQFSKGLQDLYAGRTGGKSGLSDAKKKAKELEQAMADLEAQTNRLTMTDEQFREWELTNRTLPKLREELKGAADAVQRLEKFEQATRSNWAKEDEEKAQEKARENLQIQADFYEQLREKSGQYGMGLEYVNKLIEQQAQAWKEAGIPEEYRKQLAEILRLEASTDGWDGARRAMRSYYADSMNMGRQFENFTSSTLSGLEDAFVDFAMTGKLSFSDLANSIISDLVRIAYQAMVVAPLLEALTGGKSGGGGLLGGLIGGLLGGGSSAGASMSVSGGLASGGWSPSSVFGWAKGGVFSGGNISDYSGSIVTQPTAFSFGRHLSMFAGGGGIMGEAGPEAILPLDRASNGRLGLAMSGMDDIMQQAQRGFAAESAKYMKFIAEQRQTMKPQITVNVINKTGQQVQAQTTAAPDGQGGMNMEIVLTQIEAGIVQRDAAGKSQLVNHLDRTRGLSRAGRLYR